jgi:pyruvate/2-oxoglutarate dehydrogenase complex dihydrolipoamide dehydrogenase (E3) component
MPPYDSINVHPQNHLPNTLPSTTWDVIAIGSGWAGRLLCGRAIKAGLTAVVIESELAAGDCPWWACIPSKQLLRPGDLMEDATATSGVKETIGADMLKAQTAGAGTPKIDVEAAFRQRDATSFNYDDGAIIKFYIDSLGVTFVRGEGKLVGVKKVELTNNDEKVLLTATHAVVVCTGSSARIPDIPGLKEAKPWTSRQATSSSVVPKRLLVIGAGAVGTEMATVYNTYGSRVTLVVSGSEILSTFDPEAGAMVRKGMQESGINVLLDTRVTKVERSQPGGVVTAHLSNGSVQEVDEVLVAAGRLASTANVGLETFGLLTDGTPIPVDESLNVLDVPGSWLYAGGDVNGRATLTHHSKYHGWVIGNAIVARARGEKVDSDTPYTRTTATADKLASPQVVFTSPALASVGLTQKSAAAEGRKVRIITAGMESGGTVILGGKHPEGWAQYVVEADSGKLLGCTLVGKDVGDLIHPATVAIVGGLTLDQLRHAIAPFPTASEVYLNLLDASGN